MFGFILNSILLGIGLAMDAFSVSIANGLNEPGMRRGRECMIAGVYAFFQFLMPMVGWFCVHSLVQQFKAFEPFIPWIALALLLWIGGKMLLEGIRDAKAESTARISDTARSASTGTAASSARSGSSVGKAVAEIEQSDDAMAEIEPVAPEGTHLTAGVLLLQGIATSIDALSVGFAIANYTALAAFVCALIIAAVTFAICMGGLAAGRRIGEHLNGKAGILGGCILIFIGLEIFVRGVIL